MVRLNIKGLKDHYYAGEAIEGYIVLSDIMGIQVRGIFLELYYQTVVIVHGKTTHKYVDRVDVYNRQIEGSRRFETDSIRYGFKIHIPDNAPPTISYEVSKRVEWILRVKLDIPYHRDVIKEIFLTVYNSVKPIQSVVNKVYLNEEYARLEMDKNIFEYNEAITGRFIINKIPSNLRRVRVCLYVRLEIKVEGLLYSKTYTSEYEVACREYEATELEINREYKFRLERTGVWPVTYVDQKVRSIVFILLKFDRRLAIDVDLGIPITIYHRRGNKEAEEEARPIVEARELDKLKDKIIRIMKDGGARDIVDIRFALNFEYDTDEIIRACNELVDKGLLEVVESGELLKKYRIRKRET